MVGYELQKRPVFMCNDISAIKCCLRLGLEGLRRPDAMKCFVDCESLPHSIKRGVYVTTSHF